MSRLKRGAKKLVVGIVGGVVVIIGIIAIPYPGPGWLIVFAGLAILATEFEWANRLLVFARGKYDAWVAWLKHHPLLIRLLVLGATGVVIVLTIWLLNGFGLINQLFHLPFSWLKSPLF